MKLLTKDDVCTQLGISPRCLEGMVSGHKFPPPTRIGKRNYWCEEALERWRSAIFNSQQNWRPGA